MENKKIYQIIGTIAVLAAIVVGVYFLARSSNNETSVTTSTNSDSEDVLSIKESDWVKGNREGKVKMIEYSDFQCPACGFTSTSLSELLKKYPNDIALAYRHFPLSYHEHALNAAIAAEIAGESGKFFQMHDKIFAWASNNELSDEKFLDFAFELGFDRSAFEAKMKEKKYKDQVYADQLEGKDLKLDHTPTIFINGKEYEGGLDLDSLESEIKKHL